MMRSMLFLCLMIVVVYSAPMLENSGDNAEKRASGEGKSKNLLDGEKADKNNEMGLHLDLSDFSDDELVRLAEVLQKELEKYDTKAAAAAVEEPFVLVPSELLNEDRVLSRPRRSEPRRSEPRRLAAHRPGPSIRLLQDLIQKANSEPLIILSDDDKPRNRGPRYMDDETQKSKVTNELLLTEAEIDELELRSRLAQLSDALRERALRGL
ncbi:hypothetical protein M3Y95_00707900 [Aphelenchoides besseyi]|nr:hypothetical protein M3Y95_00707900 [Aphelenchoides besseyi]